MKEFYILRHGLTTANVEHRLQGQTDTHLIEEGRKQAETARKFLMERQIHPDLVVVSPLIRTTETAEIATGLPRESFLVDPRIIEMGFGEFEMKQDKELSQEFLEEFHSRTDTYVPPKGGETFYGVLARIGSFTEMMRQRKDDGSTVLVVSHGAAIHAFLHYLNRDPITDFWKIHVGNCAVIKVTLGDRYEDCADHWEFLFDGYRTW